MSLLHLSSGPSSAKSLSKMEMERFEPHPCYQEVWYGNEAEPNEANTQTMKGSEKQRRLRRNNKKWIGVLLVAFFSQALLLIAVVVAAGFFSWEIVTLHGQVEQLQEQLDQVHHMKEKFSQEYDADIGSHLGNIQSSVNALNATIILDQLSNLQSSVNTLNTTTMDQQSNLQSSVETLTKAQDSTDTQVNSLQSSLNTFTTQQASTTSQVTSLQSSLNNLTRRVNSSADLYQGCIQDTSNCTFTQGTNLYWKSCTTDYLPISTIVSSMVVVIVLLTFFCRTLHTIQWTQDVR